MRGISRSRLLVLASVLALAPVLAVADKKQPKPGPKLSTGTEFKRVGVIEIKDWKLQIDGAPTPVGENALRLRFKVSNWGNVPLPETKLAFWCLLGGTPQRRWKATPCAGDALVVVPPLPAGQVEIVERSVQKPFLPLYHSKVKATVDYANAVSESLENNNSVVWSSE